MHSLCMSCALPSRSAGTGDNMAMAMARARARGSARGLLSVWMLSERGCVIIEHIDIHAVQRVEREPDQCASVC